MTKGRILVVDDELSFMDAHILELKAEEYDVVAAGTMAQAQRELAARQYDLVVLDVIMPSNHTAPHANTIVAQNFNCSATPAGSGPLDQWLRQASIESGPVSRKVNRGENVQKAALNPAWWPGY
jgi:CheY-like chemotaxis protein